ncbi:MAG: hypothetical protein ACJAT4_003110, partial [Granulosicoccus sp.]
GLGETLGILVDDLIRLSDLEKQRTTANIT